MINVKLPVDATGKEIPLDTSTLYREDGTNFSIYMWSYYRNIDSWFAAAHDLGAVNANELYLDQPDSWENLEEDLKAESICDYFNPGRSGCSGCQAQNGRMCSATPAVLRDISRRIRALRGDCE